MKYITKLHSSDAFCILWNLLKNKRHSLKARKIKNKVRNECFSEILSLVEEEYIITSGFGIVIENYCKKQISYNTKENENIEEEMGSVFNS